MSNSTITSRKHLSFRHYTNCSHNGAAFRSLPQNETFTKYNAKTFGSQSSHNLIIKHIIYGSHTVFERHIILRHTLFLFGVKFRIRSHLFSLIQLIARENLYSSFVRLVHHQKPDDELAISFYLNRRGVGIKKSHQLSHNLLSNALLNTWNERQ